MMIDRSEVNIYFGAIEAGGTRYRYVDILVKVASKR